MAVPVKLSKEDIDKYSGVSGLAGAKFYRLVFNIANGLRVAISMAGAWGAAGIGVLSIGGLAAIAAPLAGALAVFISLGIPVAQAKQIVREKALKSGFATGCSIVILDYGKPTLSDFVDRTHGALGGPKYMSGVYQSAYNIGLVLGYSATLEVVESERLKLANALSQSMINRAKAEGYKLYMTGWSDRTWVSNYAGEFMRQM